jgi:hypothetical protein
MWTFGKPLNEAPFEHVSHYGTKFTCARCDFREPVKVEVGFDMIQMDVYLKKLMVDTSEMIGYHSQNIWKELNGFQGYDCIEYEFVKGK